MICRLVKSVIIVIKHTYIFIMKLFLTLFRVFHLTHYTTYVPHTISTVCLSVSLTRLACAQRQSACPVCLPRLSDTDGTGRLAIFTVPSVPSCFSETRLKCWCLFAMCKNMGYNSTQAYTPKIIQSYRAGIYVNLFCFITHIYSQIYYYITTSCLFTSRHIEYKI